MRFQDSEGATCDRGQANGGSTGRHIVVNQRKSKTAAAVPVFICLLFCVIYSYFSPLVVSSFCFPSPFDILRVSHNWDVRLFVLPKHPLGLAWTGKPKDACNMLYDSAKTARQHLFIYFFHSLPFALEGTTKDVSIELKLITISRMIQHRLTLTACFCPVPQPLVFVCIYSSSAISHIFSCTKRSSSPKRFGDGHGNLRLHIERKLPVAVLMRVRPLWTCTE